MKPFYIESVGVATPGMLDWEQAQKILTDEEDFDPQEFPRYKPMLLPANERRRATDLCRLAFNVCEQATSTLENERSEFASVFASSGGDYQIIDQICRALTQEERFVSPTQFHNSVHNSAAGYWGIAAKSFKPSTSLAGFDNSFSAGLIESCLQLPEEEKLLFVCYESAPPSPLQSKRPIPIPFACAFVLSAAPSERSLAKVEISLHRGGESEMTLETNMEHAGMDILRSINPAARALPLLVLLAKKVGGIVNINAAGNQTLEVAVSPC